MNCPNCKGALSPITYEGIRIETCSGCGGEWLDNGELLHVNKVRETRFSEDERRALAQATTIKGVKLDDVDRDLVCPKCAGRTDAVNFGGNSGVIIDRCTDCGGIWLDAGEMEKVQMLVECWDDSLPEDLAKYGPRLREIAEKVDHKDDVVLSRFRLVNTIINGILDIMYRR